MNDRPEDRIEDWEHIAEMISQRQHDRLSIRAGAALLGATTLLRSAQERAERAEVYARWMAGKNITSNSAWDTIGVRRDMVERARDVLAGRDSGTLTEPDQGEAQGIATASRSGQGMLDGDAPSSGSVSAGRGDGG